MKKVFAILLMMLLLMTALCGCFFGGSIKDASVVKDNLERRGYTISEFNTQNVDWDSSFIMYNYGLTYTDNVECMLLAQNSKTYIKENTGGYSIALTEIIIVYCANEQTAQNVLENAEEVRFRYAVFGTQGNVAYWGDEYAYQAATRNKMLYRDASGDHFD